MWKANEVRKVFSRRGAAMEPGDEFVVWDTVIPTHMTVYNWENIDLTWWRKQVWIHWRFVIPVAILYLLFIFVGQAVMRNREAFKLRTPLVLWNTGLSLFSLIAVLRSFPDFKYNLNTNGFYSTVCIRGDHSVSTGFWGLLFLFSKVAELGDTVFIVLRKKPLIFLHWYHHLTVLTSCFYFYSYYEPWFVWGALINGTVHFFMYSYYALMAAGWRVPKKVAMTITAIQMCQFTYIFVMGGYVGYQKVSGRECAVNNDTMYTGLVVISSYLVLFAFFFRNAYFKKKTA